MLDTKPYVWPSGYKPGVFTYRENNLYPNDGYTHLILLEGEMELPYPSSRNQCFHVADEISEACGYMANRVGENGLLITGSTRQYLLKWSGPYVTSELINIYVKEEDIEKELLFMHLTSIINQVMHLRERNQHRSATYGKLEDAWYDLLAARRIVQKGDENV